jgi:hypothetical protein
MFAKLCVSLFLVGCHASSPSVAPGTEPGSEPGSEPRSEPRTGSSDPASRGQPTSGSIAQPQQIEAPTPAPNADPAASQRPSSAPWTAPAATPATPVTDVTGAPATRSPSRPTKPPARRPLEEPLPPTDQLPASAPSAGGAGIGETCGPNDSCAPGLVCVKYYGFAGPRGPEFRSCEIRCGANAAACPKGRSCMTVSDGPGRVCR